MNVEIVGFMKVDYTSKSSGRPVKGWNLFTLEDIQSDYGFGKKAEKLYFSDSDFTKFPKFLGTYDISFNRYGNIEGLKLLEKK